MIKKILLVLINLYQNIFSSLMKTLIGVPRFCRYEITCSDYAKNSIEKYGVLRGSVRAVKRILSCQPFYNDGKGYVA